MALQETETLMRLARHLRDTARATSGHGEAIQTNLFGSEPRDVVGNPPNIAETIEGVLREALAIIGDANSQFARTLERIGDDRVNKAMAEKNAAYGVTATGPSPSRW